VGGKGLLGAWGAMGWWQGGAASEQGRGQGGLGWEHEGSHDSKGMNVRQKASHRN